MALDLSHALFRKTQRSAGGENCVEVATNLRGVVAVRDSKNPHGPVLAFSPDQWRAFTATVR